MPVETLPSEDDSAARLSAAIAGYLDAVERGETIAPEEWAARYPDLSDELGECLAALKLIQRASASPSEYRKELKESGGFSDVAAPMEEDSTTARAFGARGYTLLGEIGRGGMGVVYKALQHKTKRLVALKSLHGDIHASPSARRRFEREVELAAALDHPGIVRVLESGQVDGRDYYAMELVSGVPLNRWMADRVGRGTATSPIRYAESDLHAMLNLFIAICDAVNYAHQHGVIHRDLKPTNIMIDRQDRPRILDFGLARTTDRSAENSVHATRTGQLVGTLPYLCPEQAAGAGDQVDIRSDLYSLGVVLYEMLTSRLPYDTGGPLDEALHNIVHASPPRPSYAFAALKGDLDAIALKALEKAKEDRYQTAASFSEDIRCYLRHEPVEANRTSRFYLIRKVYARHRTHVHVIGAVLGMVLIASAIILAQYVEVRRQRNQLDAELHSNELRRGLAHLAAGHDGLAETFLWKAYHTLPDRPALWSLISYYTQNPLRGYLVRTGWITTTAYSPDGLWLVYGNLTGGLAVHVAADLAPVYRIGPESSNVRAIAFSHDAKRLIVGKADGRLLVFAVETWQQDRELAGHAGGVIDVRVSAGRDRFISAGADRRIVVWDGLEGGNIRPTHVLRSPASITCADLSLAGDRIAVSSTSAEVNVFDAESGELHRTFSAEGESCEALRFSRDGARLALWTNGEVSLWDVEAVSKLWTADAGLSEPRPTSLWDLPTDAASTTQRPVEQKLHTCWRPALEFSPDGSVLVCAGWDAAVRLWEASSGRSLGALRSHSTAVYSAAFAPHGLTLAVGCVGALRVWSLDHFPGVRSWPVEKTAMRVCVALCRKKNLLAFTGDSGGTVRVIAVNRRAPAQSWSVAASPVTALVFSPDGEKLAVADQDGVISLRRADDGQAIRQWRGQTDRIWSLAFSPDGESLASGGHDGLLRIWQCANGLEIQTWKAHTDQILCIAFAPDGRRLLTGGTDWIARMWELESESPINQWSHREWVNAAAYSPEGRLLATSGADLTIRIARADGVPIATIHPSHTHWINALAFLDEGRVLASGGNDGAIRFWDSQTGAELSTMPILGGPVQSLAVSEHGRYLAVGAAKAVQLIDLGAAEEAISSHAAFSR